MWGFRLARYGSDFRHLRSLHPSTEFITRFEVFIVEFESSRFVVGGVADISTTLKAGRKRSPIQTHHGREGLREGFAQVDLVQNYKAVVPAKPAWTGSILLLTP